MILEVVVGVGDVVFAGVGVLRRHRDTSIVGAHVLGGGYAVQAATVGEATPRGIHLGEIRIGAPVPGVDELQDPRTVRPGLGTEDPPHRAVGVAVLGFVPFGVGAYVVHLERFVECGDHADRVVEHSDDVRERIAEEPGDPDGDVDAWPAELFEPDHDQLPDTPGLGVPFGTHTDQREDFGDVVAGGPHRRGPPHRQSYRLRVLTGVRDIPVDQGIRECHAGVVGESARDRLGIDGVEVAAGGQHVDQAPQRRSGGPGGDVAAVESM